MEALVLPALNLPITTFDHARDAAPKAANPTLRALLTALTTVRVPGREMGRRAAALILDRLAGRPAPPRVDLGFDVVLRASA